MIEERLAGLSPKARATYALIEKNVPEGRRMATSPGRWKRDGFRDLVNCGLLLSGGVTSDGHHVWMRPRWIDLVASAFVLFGAAFTAIASSSARVPDEEARA